FHDVTVASSGVADCSIDVPSLCNNTDPGPTGPSGGTQGFLVGTGYDEATGLGSLDIAKLIASWPGAPTPALQLDPTSLTVDAGSSAPVTLEPSGFTGTITYACSNNLPLGAHCSFNGNTLTIAVPPGA